MIADHVTLYQVDSKGKLRSWRMQSEDGKHRTVSGLVGGKEVVSGWVECEAKNVGRSNATTVEEQALLEVEADYKLKLDSKYYVTREEAEAAGSGTKFLSPMLAHKWEDHKGNGPFYTQPKLDGIRATITVDGILSRAGKPIVAVPHIHESVFEWLHAHPEVQALDGELYNHELKHDFDKITSLVKKVKPTTIELLESEELIQFHCYDIIMAGTFSQRLEFRDQNLDRHWCLKHVHTSFALSREQVDEDHARNIELGYEGSIIRLDAPYESKRSKSLLKRKDFFDAEYEVLELLEGKGDWAKCVKAVKFRMPDGRVQDNGEHPEAGVRGTKAALYEMWRDYVVYGKKPKLATIRYPNLTPRGFPRFGQVTAWWDKERDL